MNQLVQLFGSYLQMTYSCFDRIVISAYLPQLMRECNLVYLFHNVNGVHRVTEEVLRGRTNDYQQWVQGYALNHDIPMEWAQSGVRKEDFLKPHLKQFQRKVQTGVYYILKSMEQGSTYRMQKDGGFCRVKRHWSRFTHYYFYLFDEVLGAMVVRIGSFLPFKATCILNGHNIIQRELLKNKIDFTMKDNSFLWTADPARLQSISDELTPEMIIRRLNYWCFVLGPKFSRRERNNCRGLERSYAVTQVEYCQNFIFRKNFPIRSIFEHSCELGLYRLMAGRVSNFFEHRITRAYRGKLRHVLDQRGQGQHVFRTHYKNSFLKQYEKDRTLLRTEVVSNNLMDFYQRKSIIHLKEIESRLRKITDNFADFQAETLNIRPEFDLFARLAQPVECGKTRIPGIKLENTRLMRLFEVLLHGGASLNSWSSKNLLTEIEQHFPLKPNEYKINQLRYDLRKLRAHGLLIREKGHYSYQLTQTGRKAALLFLLFAKKIFGTIAGSLFLYKPNAAPSSKLEQAFSQVEQSIDALFSHLQAA